MIKHAGGKGKKNCPGFSPWSCSVLFVELTQSTVYVCVIPEDVKREKKSTVAVDNQNTSENGEESEV